MMTFPDKIQGFCTINSFDAPVLQRLLQSPFSRITMQQIFLKEAVCISGA